MMNIILLNKKNCESTSNLPTSTTKNLANNRLKRLKDQIQADLISRNKGNLSDDGLPSTKSIGKTNKNNSSSRSLVKSNKIDYTIQKKYEQILSEHEVDKPLNHSFNSPNLLCKKNLANERLQNIKKKLIDTDHNPDSSSTSNKIKDKINTSVPESSHCPIVKINENKIVGGLKRNINITNTYDFDAFESSSKRLAVEPSALSRP
ncbi:hypothetical protein NQ314_005677 [Rhamnusium bicolor]|uniref:Exophilin 5 n=1 Tax=Rhamnusium bicolor TaxID=1586634 RepID=A0AAV8ZGD0_9CUCU|nr:hypothetical protein NQ314_005677 [Rhamnusium bicolor]